MRRYDVVRAVPFLPVGGLGKRLCPSEENFRSVPLTMVHSGAFFIII